MGHPQACQHIHNGRSKTEEKERGRINIWWDNGHKLPKFEWKTLMCTSKNLNEFHVVLTQTDLPGHIIGL